MLVRNMCSPNSISGYPVKNQFIIETKRGSIFQSYKTVIAVREGGKVYLSEDWNYSSTTLKYLKIFLDRDDTLRSIRDCIDSGLYQVRNLETLALQML